MEDETVFWRSDTHQGSILRLTTTTFDGEPVDVGIWADATEIKTGRAEHALPYDSVEAALKRLTEKYGPVSLVGEPDAVSK
jgi:hypothetical protein